jgi:bifunctional UDP-N-acetylglucosamine pyrophosphorylase/glucosamine-1-phosphate N-acetyltransferase
MAAGHNSDMKSDYPGVLHEVAGEPLLSHVMETSRKVAASRTIVVLDFKSELIKGKLPPGIEWVEQKRQSGTRHVLMQLKSTLKNFKGELLILCGDTPLLHGSTLKQLVAAHRQKKAHATVLTAILHDPTGYGRIIRNNDRIVRIVEEKKATIYEKAIEEANSGTCCFDRAEFFSSLEQTRRVRNKISNGIKPESYSGRYRLTDIIGLMARRRKKVFAFMSEDRNEILGVNSRLQLSAVNKILHQRIARIHMGNGVTIIDPDSTFIDKKVKIGRDSIIYPFTILEGKTVIGEKCRVGPAAHLISVIMGNEVRCRQVVIKDKKIKEGKSIGPYKVL